MMLTGLTHALADFLARPQCARLGLTLLHFLWQGALLAAAAEGSAVLLRLRPGRPRYAAYLLALVVMAACPIVTYRALPRGAMPEAAAPALVAHGSDALADAIPAAGPAAPTAAAPAAAGGSHPDAARPANWAESARAWLAAVLPWAAAAWAAGVALLAVRLLAGLVGLSRLKRGAAPLPEPLVRRAEALAERLGVRGFCGAFTSGRVSQPCAVGLWRPVVLLPAALLTGMPVELLEAVIAHELAHIRRLDPWVNLAQRVLETLLFYHPAVWWLSARVRREREVCCDGLAAATTEPEACAVALEHVARFALGLPAARAEEFAMAKFALAFGGRTDLLYRVRHLLGAPAGRPRPGWPAGAVALAVLVVAVAASQSSSWGQARPGREGRGGPDRGRPSTREDQTGGEGRGLNAVYPVGDLVVASDAADRSAGGGDAPGASGSNALPTPQEEAREEARAQAAREVRRADLSVEEAQVTLEAKVKDLDRLAKLHDQKAISNEDLDRARLEVSLARIKLERSKLDLEDARAKFQTFTPSSVSLRISMEPILGPGSNGLSRTFSVRGREVTLKQLLGQVRKPLDENFETKGTGRVTVTRDENGTARAVVDAVPVKEVLDGRTGEIPLRASDTVQVSYQSQQAINVGVRVEDRDLDRPSGSFVLPRRDMTVTQAIGAWLIDPKAAADDKVILERKEKDGYRKVLDGVPLHDLLDGKVKDEIVQSNDRIEIKK